MGDAMKLGLVLSAVDKMSMVVDKAVKKSSARLKNFEESAAKINGTFSAIGGAGIVAGINSAMGEAGRQIKANKRLEHVFKSMWGDSGVVKEAAKQQEKFADKLSLATGIDAEIIKTTQAKLATFQHVSNKTAVMSGVFTRATKAAQDMAAIGFGEAEQNAVLLGKALEDPMHMATALKKMGTLTANEVVGVKQIAATKGLAAAQQYLLKAVERQVGGASEATASATDLMNQQWKRVNEALGKSFLPAMKNGKIASGQFAQQLVDFIGTHQALIKYITIGGLVFIAFGLAIKGIMTIVNVAKASLALFRLVASLTTGTIDTLRLKFWYAKDAVRAWNISSKLAAAGQWLLNTSILGCPIIWIIAGIAGLSIAITLAWKKFAWFRAGVKASWEVIKGFGKIVKDFVIDRIKGVISGLGSMGKAIALLFKGKFAAAGQTALQGVKDLSGITAVQTAVKHTVALGRSVPGVYSHIYAQENKVEKPQSKAISALRSPIVPAGNIQRTTASNTPSLHYAPTIHVNGGSPTVKQDLMKILNTHKDEIARFLKQLGINQNRLSFS
jgi:hypothetical protein